MTKKKPTTTKTVEPVVTKTIETPIATKTNTNGIANLNQGKKNTRKPTTYRLYKERKDRKIQPVLSAYRRMHNLISRKEEITGMDDIAIVWGEFFQLCLQFLNQ